MSRAIYVTLVEPLIPGEPTYTLFPTKDDALIWTICWFDRGGLVAEVARKKGEQWINDCWKVERSELLHLVKNVFWWALRDFARAVNNYMTRKDEYDSLRAQWRNDRSSVTARELLDKAGAERSAYSFMQEVRWGLEVLMAA